MTVGNELTTVYPGSPLELRLGFYILDEDHNPVFIGEDCERYIAFRMHADNIVARTSVGRAVISTVFLGTDHNWCDDGPPILFETMIFGGYPEIDLEQSRCATWKQAEHEHWCACQVVTEVMRGRVQGVIDGIAISALCILGLIWVWL